MYKQILYGLYKRLLGHRYGFDQLGKFCLILLGILIIFDFLLVLKLNHNNMMFLLLIILNLLFDFRHHLHSILLLRHNRKGQALRQGCHLESLK